MTFYGIAYIYTFICNFHANFYAIWYRLYSNIFSGTLNVHYYICMTFLCNIFIEYHFMTHYDEEGMSFIFCLLPCTQEP